MNNKKDGFILLYSVAIIAVIAVLITSIVTMAAGTNKNNNLLDKQFERRTAIDQIGEYFIADSAGYTAKIQELAKKYGLTADILQNAESDSATLTLKDGSVVVLAVTVTGSGDSKTFEWRYNAEEDNAENLEADGVV